MLLSSPLMTGVCCRNTCRAAFTLYCSFCGLGQHEVYLMIAGQLVFMRDSCIEIAGTMLAEKRAQDAHVAAVLENAKPAGEIAGSTVGWPGATLGADGRFY